METFITILQIVFPVVGTIAVAVIGTKATKERKESEEHAKRRERAELLSMKMQDANMQLAMVTANAVMGGHNNGNVERAYAAAAEATHEYQLFLQESTAKEIVNK